ncbi:hypothetical protein L6452_08682 [Arctium lappa]|uniref:Uncharacterized protein n=1 Tax=Arctium lappa TaxID=4217 RepID=A0ACB9DI62_ARCLA|nr:hypothetical protein L6452_08682 [Arctium lappa]
MKLRKYMGAPRRLLRRAREVYIERMVILDEKIGPITNMSGFPPPAPPPHNFGANYWTINHTSNSTHKDPVLLRTASERIPTITSEEFDIDEVQHCYSSLGLGRMGTIHEDKWYEFDEEINIRIDLYISKSRSQAIGRRSVGGYY